MSVSRLRERERACSADRYDPPARDLSCGRRDRTQSGIRSRDLEDRSEHPGETSDGIRPSSTRHLLPTHSSQTDPLPDRSYTLYAQGSGYSESIGQRALWVWPVDRGGSWVGRKGA